MSRILATKRSVVLDFLNSVDIDGVDQAYIDVPDNTLEFNRSDKFTFSYWVFIKNITPSYHFYSGLNQIGNFAGVSLRMHTGSIYRVWCLNDLSPADYILADFPPSDIGRWVHYITSYDGGGVVVGIQHFYDLVAQIALNTIDNSTEESWSDGVQPNHWGAFANGLTTMPGKLAHIQVYKGLEATAAQREKLFSLGKIPGVTPTQEFLMVGENSPTVVDTGLLEVNGTLNGAATFDLSIPNSARQLIDQTRTRIS